MPMGVTNIYLAVSQLTSGTPAVGAVGTSAVYYYVSSALGANLKISFVDGDGAGLSLNIYSQCPSTGPSAINTFSGTTNYYVLAYGSRTYFAVTAPSGSHGYSLRIDVSDSNEM